MEPLSSKLTFFYKFIMPIIFVGPFALLTTAMFVAPDFVAAGRDLADTRWVLLGWTVFMALPLYWACMRLKRVALEDHQFVISNYLRTVRVPYRDVEAVSSDNIP